MLYVNGANVPLCLSVFHQSTARVVDLAIVLFSLVTDILAKKKAQETRYCCKSVYKFFFFLNFIIYIFVFVCLFICLFFFR